MNTFNSNHRKQGERYPFRSGSRFFHEPSGWFIYTREGILGPYATREDAETEAMLLIRGHETVDAFGVEAEHRFHH